MDYAPTTSDSGQAGSLPHDGQAGSLPYEESSPPEFAGEAPKRSKRRQTTHLKLVPETRELRDQLHAKCREVAAGLDKARPPSAVLEKSGPFIATQVSAKSLP